MREKTDGAWKDNAELTLSGADYGVQFKRHGLGEPVPASGVQLVGQTEVKAVGDALAHAGRLQPLIDAVQAVVAFDYLAHLGLPLGAPQGQAAMQLLHPTQRDCST